MAGPRVPLDKTMTAEVRDFLEDLAAQIASLQTGRVLATTAVPAGGTIGTGIKISSTVNFGIFFGSNVPTLSAAKGSIYLRTDGTGVNDRAYINTDGGVTWTAIVTVA